MSVFVKHFGAKHVYFKCYIKEINFKYHTFSFDYFTQYKYKNGITEAWEEANTEICLQDDDDNVNV